MWGNILTHIGMHHTRSFSQRSRLNFNHGTYSTYAHKTPRDENSLLSHTETKFCFHMKPNFVSLQETSISKSNPETKFCFYLKQKSVSLASVVLLFVVPVRICVPLLVDFAQLQACVSP
jgi:hypothetical protein